MDGKRCQDCGEIKPLDQFHKNSSRRDGRQGWCKECHNRRARDWRAANPDYSQVRLSRDPDYFRRRRIQQRYGITLEEYEARRKAQGDRCGICQQAVKRLDVDHSHRDGRVRGLLCVPCNTALRALESPDWFGAAYAYLERSGEHPSLPRDGVHPTGIAGPSVL
jgi:hypothetical protein